MKIKLILSSLWLIFTSSMVGWWWFYGMAELAKPYSTSELESRRRMLFWEGSFFLCAIILGGFFLIYFLYQDNEKNKALRSFFSIFSHDLKTSIARLRLQSDVLREDESFSKNKILQRIVKDINKLDLQLENSLWLAQIDNLKFIYERFLFSEILFLIRSDFPEVSFELNKDVELFSDKRSLVCILRNLIQNAIIHGQADTISLKTESSGNKIRIKVVDNGIGCEVLPQFKKSFFSRLNLQKTTGLGLSLSYQILKKIKGDLIAALNGKQIEFIIELSL